MATRMIDLDSLFASFAGTPVAVVGDVMIDSYLWGRADRISPEAPIPVVEVLRREARPGGAANVAANVKALGGAPLMLAAVGDDPRGRQLAQLLSGAGIDPAGLLPVAGRATTVKHRVIAAGQHLLRVDEETPAPLGPDDQPRFLAHCLARMQEARPRAIVFEDYDKGNLTPGVIAGIVDYARRNGIPTLVDPKRRNYHCYNGVTLFKPNFKELVEGSKLDGIDKGDTEALFGAAEELRLRLGAGNVMVTLSEHGVVVAGEGLRLHLPAQRREIADVSGAGDTVVSVLALALACGAPVGQAAAMANIAGGQVCEKVGVVTVDAVRLLDECRAALGQA